MAGCAVCTGSEQGVDGHNYHGQRGGSGTPAARVSHGAKLPEGACPNTVTGSPRVTANCPAFLPRESDCCPRWKVHGVKQHHVNAGSFLARWPDRLVADA